MTKLGEESPKKVTLTLLKTMKLAEVMKTNTMNVSPGWRTAV